MKTLPKSDVRAVSFGAIKRFHLSVTSSNKLVTADVRKYSVLPIKIVSFSE
jgi:hypothetical protein